MRQTCNFVTFFLYTCRDKTYLLTYLLLIFNELLWKSKWNCWGRSHNWIFREQKIKGSLYEWITTKKRNDLTTTLELCIRFFSSIIDNRWFWVFVITRHHCHEYQIFSIIMSSLFCFSIFTKFFLEDWFIFYYWQSYI